MATQGLLEIEPFEGGQSNPTYRLAAGGRRYVLRKKPAGVLQGIAKRALDGTATSTQAVETGRRARPIADAGWRLVESRKA